MKPHWRNDDPEKEPYFQMLSRQHFCVKKEEIAEIVYQQLDLDFSTDPLSRESAVGKRAN